MRQWTIGKRMIFAFAVVLTTVLGAGIFNSYEAGATREAVNQVVTDSIPSLQCIADVRLMVRANGSLTYQHIGSDAEADMKAIESQINENAAKVVEDLAAYKKLAALEPGMIEQVESCRNNYVAVRTQILEQSRQATNAVDSARLYHHARTVLDPAAKAFIAALDKCQEQEQRDLTAAAAEARQATINNQRMSWTGMAVALILCSGLALWITRSIGAILRRVSASLDDGSVQVTEAASQVSTASQSLASGSSEQASSLEETSSSLEELASMTRRNSENTRTAADLTRETRAAADKGVGDMEQMARAMDAIKVSSDDIAKIIKTIDEIAFQTNILALNAAVEAARAGEAGMGFAVVADEVRNLAQRCAHAAKETAGKIEGAIAKAGQGVEITGKVAGALNQIVTKVRSVDELVTEIATASREQTEGITQINTAVSQMDQLTQGNAASAEQSAAAAQELNAQAQMMRNSVSELLELVGGRKGNVSTPVSLSLPLTKAARPVKLAKKFSPGVNGHKNGNGHAAELPMPAPRQSQPKTVEKGDFVEF